MELKRDDLCDAGIIAAIGVHPSTFHCWLKEGGDAMGGVKRALHEETKGQRCTTRSPCSRPSRTQRCSARRLLIFEEHFANKTMPADTGKIVVDSLAYADDTNGKSYFHDQIVFCDDTPDSKVRMNVWRPTRLRCTPPAARMACPTRATPSLLPAASDP